MPTLILRGLDASLVASVKAKASQEGLSLKEAVIVALKDFVNNQTNGVVNG